jgi:hypothetical protein
MVALRMVAACVLATAVTSLGVAGLRIFGEMRKKTITEKAVSSILEAARLCLATSADQVLEIELFQPVELVENKVMIGGSIYGEFEGRFCQQVRINPGKHLLRLRFTDNGIRVEA